jgi:hypothetical protein
MMQMTTNPLARHSGRDRSKHDDSESDSDSASDEGVVGLLKRERHPNQFIIAPYEDLVKWMSEYLATNRPANWVRDWKAIFSKVLPRHTFLRYEICKTWLVLAQPRFPNACWSGHGFCVASTQSMLIMLPIELTTMVIYYYLLFIICFF